VSGGGRLRGSLVIAEVALAMVLLVCAGLFGRSLAYLRAVNPGFDDRNVLTASVAPAGPAYRTNAQKAAYFGRAPARVREVPRVRHAAFITYLPVSGAGRRSARPRGGETGPPGGAPHA